MSQLLLKKSTLFSEQLLNWFDRHGRKDLPWQHDKTPYRVWVSEIMLQQTQVNSVIEYYQRFMQSFPTIDSLAEAEEDTVLEHWAGLGYYARARNLHKTAKIVVNELNNNFPDNLEEIVKLPGIGRSTAGAVLSIAFKQSACILDGNVKRVLCRFHGIDTWPGEKQTENHLWTLAEQHTPAKRNDDYTQAIMDLGATCCTRSKPNCERCPFAETCVAFEKSLQKQIPKSKPKKAIPQRETWIALIEHKGKILLEKRPPTGIWGSLYSLPEFNAELTHPEAQTAIEDKFNIKLNLDEMHESIQHTFSHFKLEMKPLKLSLQTPDISSQIQIQEVSRFHWHEKSQLHTIGLPAPIAKYLKSLIN
jgi:A/G-specific adenine glycosylase